MDMNILSSVLLALISLLLPLANAFAQSGAGEQQPPSITLAQDDFSPMAEEWTPASGRWAVANGTYGDSFAGNNDITTITSYNSPFPGSGPAPKVSAEDFTLRARVLNLGVDDTHRVGIVYGYQDSQNYYEVVVSAIGTVHVRTVTNGIGVEEREPLLTGNTRNIWTDLEVRWKNGVTTLKVNGQSIFPYQQPEFTTGQVGLVTHSAVGRFDKVLLTEPLGGEEFFETFDQPQSVTFTPQSGQWSVSNGAYRSGVQQTSVSLAPFHTGLNHDGGDAFDYTFSARLFNGYTNSGNLVGIVFNYSSGGYTELVFSATGVAKLNRFENGVLTNIATTTCNCGSKVAFDVKIENGTFFTVTVDGQRLFESVTVGDVDPLLHPEGGVGLITHWSPGKFDNIRFDYGFFHACSLTFAQPPPPRIVSGTWNVDGGTLNNTSVEQSSIVVADNCAGDTVGDNAGQDVVYRARLRNEFGASGNRVGLIFNYQNGFYAGDYYEIVFSTTGIAQLNKYIEGVLYPVRTRHHNVPRNTWFDLEVIRSGIFTTIKVNGTQIFNPEPQGELRGGVLGFISHWTKGHFDDVQLVEDHSPVPPPVPTQ